MKETAETEYWLRLLILSEYIEKEHGESMLCDCLESFYLMSLVVLVVPSV